MNKTITLCNHCAESNKYGKPLGHSLKVTEEYYDVISGSFEIIDLCTVKSIAQNISDRDFNKITELPFEINVDAPFTLSRRIKDKLGFFKSIRRCIECDTDAIFFYQSDFFLFLYLYIRYGKRTDKHLYALTCRDDFSGGRIEGVLQHVFRRGIRKLDGLIYTMPKAQINHPNKIWISDYVYSEAKYGKWRNYPKEKKIVCLGTMNRYKDLEGVVRVFANSEIKVEIIGAFDEKERVTELKKMSTDNIIIEDRVPNAEEYYELMASAAFGLLPYNMNQYHNRTSGVLLETVFTGAIPIAPEELLRNNDCEGIAYTDIAQLKADDIINVDVDAIIERQIKKLNDCSMEATKERICSFLAGEGNR